MVPYTETVVWLRLLREDIFPIRLYKPVSQSVAGDSSIFEWNPRENVLVDQWQVKGDPTWGINLQLLLESFFNSFLQQENYVGYKFVLP